MQKVSQKDYVRAANTLAMRRYQAGLAKGKQKESYEEEILVLREDIRTLLHPS